MKKFTSSIVLACMMFAGFLVNGQTNVTLVIDHKLGSSDFQMNQTAQNNLGNDFQLSRMQYYVTRFSVIHDGGQVLSVNDNVVALVNAQDYTAIPLGQFNVTSIEGIKFHIGVFDPVNTADPSLQPSGSALAHQNPSMHWGWTAGYRFIALEGLSGPNVNQTTELHGLGNQNYFETTVMTYGEMINGEQFISITADYTQALRNIDVSSGLVVHGTGQEAAQMITNFRDYVFTGGQSVAGIEVIAFQDVKVYPIPSKGKITIETPAEFIGTSVTLFNANGQIVKEMDVLSGGSQMEVTLGEKGLFLLILETQNKQKKIYKIVNE